jgi:hypothetical protein
MIITREGLIAYWASEPVSKREPGRIILGLPPFPDLTFLTAAEKKILRDVIAKHPEYLENEIECSAAVIQ